jgi:hypothetical protein
VSASRFEGSAAFAVQSIAEHRLSDWATQLIGVFGYTETYLPSVIVIAWYCAVAIFATRGFQAADRNLRRLLCLLALAMPVLLLGLETFYLWRIGFSQNGRYVFPLWVAVLLLTGHAIPSAFRLARGIAIMAAIVQIWALAEVMTRFQHGPNHVISPFSGEWIPPAGPAVVLAIAFTGAVLLVIPFWMRRVDRPSPARPNIPKPHAVNDRAFPRQTVQHGPAGRLAG